ncbi:hypothetical protein L1987_00264 [Smallanthus sonchifolius]|uniref:Uncharacterized protein n=1 Tax=Smallanthus sonchifolius TaxID=185202 RepID=A0ACB9K216_9ASTR|nr:hypothetical protein L1987_00264 [Smallanthus sonchifolius]
MVQSAALQSNTHVVMDSIVLEQPSSSSTACSDRCGGGGGSRAIDRHNPIIRDEKRLGQGRIFPSSSTITDQSHLHSQKPEAEGGDQKRKSVAFANNDEFIKASDNFISPASSSRCLLSDIAMSYSSSEFHHIPSPPPQPHEHLNLPQPPPSSPPVSCDGLKPPESPPHEPMKFHYSEHHNSLSSAATKPPSPPYPPPSTNQVVVLEVALHCRGCERKMKKHISKIEGVTSFKIEFAAKKVTVVGDVTTLAVLTSVLKVKNAKLLAPATISSSAQIGSNGS